MDSIELPSGFGAFIGALGGALWPKEMEGDFAASSEVWDSTGQQIDGMQEDLGAARNVMLVGLDGPTGKQFASFIDQLAIALPQLSQGASALSGLAMNTALNLQYSKIMMLEQFVVTAVTIAELTDTVFGIAAVPAVEAAAEFIAESIASQLAKGVAKAAAEGAALGAGMDAAVQLFQYLKYGKPWNWQETEESVVVGAIGGGLGALGGLGAVKVLGEDVANSLVSHVVQGAANGAVTSEIANQIFGGGGSVGLGAAAGALGGAAGHLAHVFGGSKDAAGDGNLGDIHFTEPNFKEVDLTGDHGSAVNGGPGDGPFSTSITHNDPDDDLNDFASIYDVSVHGGSVDGGSIEGVSTESSPFDRVSTESSPFDRGSIEFGSSESGFSHEDSISDDESIYGPITDFGPLRLRESEPQSPSGAPAVDGFRVTDHTLPNSLGASSRPTVRTDSGGVVTHQSSVDPVGPDPRPRVEDVQPLRGFDTAPDQPPAPVSDRLRSVEPNPVPPVSSAQRSVSTESDVRHVADENHVTAPLPVERVPTEAPQPVPVVSNEGRLDPRVPNSPESAEPSTLGGSQIQHIETQSEFSPHDDSGPSSLVRTPAASTFTQHDADPVGNLVSPEPVVRNVGGTPTSDAPRPEVSTAELPQGDLPPRPLVSDSPGVEPESENLGNAPSGFESTPADMPPVDSPRAPLVPSQVRGDGGESPVRPGDRLGLDGEPVRGPEGRPVAESDHGGGPDRGPSHTEQRSADPVHTEQHPVGRVEAPRHDNSGTRSVVGVHAPALPEHAAPTGPSRHEQWEDAKAGIQRDFSDRFDYTVKTERVADAAKTKFEDALVDRGIVRTRLGLRAMELSSDGRDEVLRTFQTEVKDTFDERFGTPGSGYDTAVDHVTAFQDRLHELSGRLPALIDRQALWERAREVMRDQFDRSFDAHSVIAARRELLGPRAADRFETQRDEAWKQLEPELRKAFDDTAADSSPTDLASAWSARFDALMRDEIPKGIALHDQLLHDLDAGHPAAEAFDADDRVVRQRITSEFESVSGRPFAGVRTDEGALHLDDAVQPLDWRRELSLDKELRTGFDAAVASRAADRAELGLDLERLPGSPEHGLTYGARAGNPPAESEAEAHRIVGDDVGPEADAETVHEWLPGRDLSDAGLERVKTALADEIAAAAKEHFADRSTGDTELEAGWRRKLDALIDSRLPERLDYEAAYERQLKIGGRDFEDLFERWSGGLSGGHLEDDGIERVRKSFGEDFRAAYDEIHRAAPDRWHRFGGTERAWRAAARKVLHGVERRFSAEELLVSELGRAAGRFDRLREFKVDEEHAQELARITGPTRRRGMSRSSATAIGTSRPGSITRRNTVTCSAAG
jgi:hypothetical protein